MSERKVINKYFPPDFDPSKIPRRRLKDKNQQQVIRLMAPFSMRCNSCGEYIYKGKKFNARKETVTNEDYYGIRIFRFYIKCTLCSTEITFKTDPKNADYICEHGASRNFESWRDDAAEQAEKAYMPNADEDDEEEGGESEQRKEHNDAMRALEESTEASKREMDILDALQDIRQRNARNERVGITLSETTAAASEKAALEKVAALTAAEEEDEELVRAVFARIPAAGGAVSSNGKGKGRAVDGTEGEKEDEDDEDDEANERVEQQVIIKRKLAGAEGEPTLAMLLSEKGLAPPKPAVMATSGNTTARGGGGGGFGFAKEAANGGGGGGAKKRKIGGPMGGLVLKKKK